jgi:hypothetical protein
LEGVHSVLFDLDLEVASFLLLVLSRLVDVGSVVVDFCDGNGTELVPEGIEGHEEYSIFLIKSKADSLLLCRVDAIPSWVRVRPLTCILTLSPGISQLNKSELLVIMVENDGIEKSIGVALNNS